MHTILAENTSNIESPITSYKVCYQALLRVSLYRGNERKDPEEGKLGQRVKNRAACVDIYFDFCILDKFE
jgi:hypothetical protein